MKPSSKAACSVAAIIALVTGGAYQADPPMEEPAVFYETNLAFINDSKGIVSFTSAKPIGLVEINGQAVGELKVSPRALEVIGNAEGCRLEPYQCPAGLLTDGIGNTHGVIGSAKTHEQIAIDWVKNIQSSEKCLIASKGDVLMSQGHIDAFTSFIFNTGCTRFRHNPDGSETRIYKHIHQGSYKRACNELRFWVFSNGQRLGGLVTRRHKEMAICLTP